MASIDKKRTISFVDAINESLHLEMKRNKNLLCYGLGINDPKKIFGTTKNLEKKFGSNRVFDIPNSENSILGIGIGLAMSGYPNVVTHQRLDFFLLAFDQLINSASKWFYMFGKNSNIPITIRLVVGRGWGQGPTHSQNLQSVFSHFPGLKVVIPTNPFDAKGLLSASIRDPNPVIFIEHRWLHNTIGDVPKENYTVNLGNAKKISSGKNLTVISMSYMTVEFLKILKFLQKKISIDFIDLRSIKPLDIKTIKKSVKKTGRVLVLDTGFKFNSISSEIITQINENCFNFLKEQPKRITVPNIPEPASFGLTKYYYPSLKNIIDEVSRMTKIKFNQKELKLFLNTFKSKYHDVPGDWFKGPF